MLASNPWAKTGRWLMKGVSCQMFNSTALIPRPPLIHPNIHLLKAEKEGPLDPHDAANGPDQPFHVLLGKPPPAQLEEVKAWQENEVPPPIMHVDLAIALLHHFLDLLG